MNYLKITLFALFLTGCTQFQTYEAVGRTKGAAAYDKALEVAVYTICDASSRASLRRRFGTSEESVKIYTTFCALKDMSTTAEVISPQ